MLQLIDGTSERVIAVEAVGKVTGADYDAVLAPAIDAMKERDGSVRVVYVLGEAFDGWSAGAMWEDLKLGARDFRAWEKIAIVTDKDALRHGISAFGWMMPGEVKVFPTDQQAEAIAWAAL